MKRILIITLCIALLAPLSAMAQDGPLDKLQDGLSFFKRKAADLVSPGAAGESVEIRTREFSASHPVSAKPVLNLANLFGDVRVLPWKESVVNVTAKISVGAVNGEDAQRILDSVDIRFGTFKQDIDVQTCLPDTSHEKNLHEIAVEYVVHVPAHADVHIENEFGDILIRGIEGEVSVDAQFGAVTLRDLGGAVLLLSRGDFPVEVSGLRHGGRFYLHGGSSSFSDCDGKLTISNILGAAVLMDLSPNVELDISSENGSVEITAPPNIEPAISATLFHGTLDSDFPLERTEQGSRMVARSPVEASGPRYTLSASFAPIVVRRSKGVTPSTPPEQTGRAGRPFTEQIEEQLPAPDNCTLSLNADQGNITITGSDDDEVRVKATRLVWVRRPAQAAEALAALDVHVLREGNQIIVVSKTPADMDALGCTAYRIDLEISCPRTLPITITAREGTTRVTGVGGKLTVHQERGEISAEHIKGPLDLRNGQGTIVARHCAGPLEAETRGNITLEEIYDSITVRGEAGRTVLIAPHGGVNVRNKSGDVRILALKGPGGNWDVKVEKGDLSVLLSPESNASLSLITKDGTVLPPAFPLDGRITVDGQEMHTRLKDGRHRLVLETQGGDIALD